jgi:hypothetical protein
MRIFDLLFLASALVSAVALGSAAVTALRGKGIIAIGRRGVLMIGA